MVAASGVRRWGWPAAAALAASFLAVLAFHGTRPEPGLLRFEAAGVLADWSTAEIVAVELTAAERQVGFRRDAGGQWRSAQNGAPAPADLAQRIETGLTLLRNSSPQRRDLPAGQAAEFGLAPPRLAVLARAADGKSRQIDFGGVNPLGLQRYARVAGEDGIMLLPTFVADPWESVAAAR